MTLAEVNALGPADFVAEFGGIFEHSPWVAERATAARPFATLNALHAAMVTAMLAAKPDEQMALLRAHPELAGRAAIRGELTAESTREQAGAGLDQCSPAEYAQLTELNARYNAKFGFPFIVAVRGLDRADILREFARRVEQEPGTEFAEALRQVAQIARYRLEGSVTT